MATPVKLRVRIVCWALFLFVCAGSAFVYMKLDTYDPLRPLSPDLRREIAEEMLDWDARHSGWTQKGGSFSSYGVEFAVIAGVTWPEGTECEQIYFKVFDATGQPIYYEKTDVCGKMPWAMGWDEEDRLWLVAKSGEIRCWEHAGGKEWIERQYTAGVSPTPPAFE